MDPETRDAIRGVAAIAYTMCEMGGCTDGDVVFTIAHYLEQTGHLTAINARHIADAISAIPQPEDRPAHEVERCRPIEDGLGLASAEQQLNAQLRAREAALRLADKLDHDGSPPPLS